MNFAFIHMFFKHLGLILLPVVHNQGFAVGKQRDLAFNGGLAYCLSLSPVKGRIQISIDQTEHFIRFSFCYVNKQSCTR